MNKLFKGIETMQKRITVKSKERQKVAADAKMSRMDEEYSRRKFPESIL